MTSVWDIIDVERAFKNDPVDNADEAPSDSEPTPTQSGPRKPDQYERPPNDNPPSGPPAKSDDEDSEDSEDSEEEDSDEGQSDDEVQQSIEDRMQEREKLQSENTPDYENRRSRSRGTPGDKTALKSLTDIKDLVDKIKPKIKWRDLIKQFVQSSTPRTTSTFSRPSVRSVGTIAVAARVGAGAMKPGVKIEEDAALDLALVFDTSGSMSGHIPTVLSEAASLLKQAGKLKNPLLISFFAGETLYFKVNVGENWFAEIKDLDDFYQVTDPSSRVSPWNGVLGKAGSGGTVFSTATAKDLSTLSSKKYNVILFSDSDIMWGENWDNFFNLWKTHKANVSFIASDENTWREACKKAGQVPKNWSHLD